MRQVYDNLGAVGYSTSYDPYGVPFDQHGSLLESLGFTGEMTDRSGLQYLRARYYSPSLGVFLSPDPVQGVLGGSSIHWNPYIYAGANPVNYVDPSGRIFWIPLLLGALKWGLAAFEIATLVDWGSQAIGNLNQGMAFGQAVGSIDILGGAGRGLEWGVNVAAGYLTGGVINRLMAQGAITAARGWALGGLADVTWGVGWDMTLHGDNFGAALGTNLIGFGLGEVAGFGLKQGIHRAFNLVTNPAAERATAGMRIGWELDNPKPTTRIGVQTKDHSCIAACAVYMLREGQGSDVAEDVVLKALKASGDEDIYYNTAVSRLNTLVDKSKMEFEFAVGDPEDIVKHLDEGHLVAANLRKHSVIIDSMDPEKRIATILDPFGPSGPGSEFAEIGTMTFDRLNLLQRNGGLYALLIGKPVR